MHAEPKRSAERPLVSVVIPCYRQAHFLSDAIDSVLAQTYPHHEIVVVDDGSPDETAAVAGKYPHVRYVHQENQGLSAARNTGIRASAGSCVVCLDADDRLTPDALAIGVRELTAVPRAAFSGGNQRLIRHDGQVVPAPPRAAVVGDVYRALLARNPFWCPAVVMYRRSIFDEVGGFDPAMNAVADFEMYVRIARCFPVHAHEHVVAEYRLHENAMSGNHGLMLAGTIRVLRDHRRAAGSDRGIVDACNAGIAACRSWYGERLIGEIAFHLRGHAWRHAAARVRVALQYYPLGLFKLASQGGYGPSVEVN